MLKLITCITEDKQGLLCGKSRHKNTGWSLRGFGLQLCVYRSKKEGYTILRKYMYVPGFGEQR